MRDGEEITVSQAIRVLRIQREDAQRGARSRPFDDLLKQVQAEEQPPVARPKLRAVTEENAAQFKPAPKRRGRPPNVSKGGNVVALRPTEPKALPPAPDDPDLRFRVRARAAGMALKAKWRGESSDFDACLAKAWASLGYSPPEA